MVCPKEIEWPRQFSLGKVKPFEQLKLLILFQLNAVVILPKLNIQLNTETFSPNALPLLGTSAALADMSATTSIRLGRDQQAIIHAMAMRAIADTPVVRHPEFT
mmetsp:Transcript_28884/g.63617  ORF Transcript_28884/g.63617 Transcript_28884/m.63617 type:complete len:104 (-) Transcript_28884:227-538(-)